MWVTTGPVCGPRRRVHVHFGIRLTCLGALAGLAARSASAWANYGTDALHVPQAERGNTQFTACTEPEREYRRRYMLVDGPRALLAEPSCRDMTGVGIEPTT